MLDLEGPVRPVATHAGPPPFLEEILPDLVAGQRALLVCDPTDLRGDHLLHVESDPFHG